MSIFTVAPITWTNDTVNNANTFNAEIKDKMTNIDTNVATKTGVETLTNKTLTSPTVSDVLMMGDDSKLLDINVANTIGIYGTTDPTIGAIKLGSGGGIISGANGVITLSSPVMNGVVRIAVLRKNITTDTYINNTVILTGWNFITASNTTGLSKDVTFGITFSEVPIITITPIGKKAGSDPSSISDFYNHSAIEAGKAISPSVTGFLAHIWTTAAYDLNDRVGFMWTAIGQYN